MRTAVSREAYFDTGLAVLSELGYGGLKLAEVCNRLGVTTGSFYHHFAGWPVYTRELMYHWMDTYTLRQVELVRTEPDPRRRVDLLVTIGEGLEHGAEAAIRAWSSADPEVRKVQAEVDQLRFDVLYETALELVHDAQQAKRFASWGMYVQVGFEQALIRRDLDVRAWLVERLVEAIDSDRFAASSCE